MTLCLFLLLCQVFGANMVIGSKLIFVFRRHSQTTQLVLYHSEYSILLDHYQFSFLLDRLLIGSFLFIDLVWFVSLSPATKMGS